MRIVAGAWRGRVLAGPGGPGTRATSDRARQAVFDMIAHAPWGRNTPLEDAPVLDAFAGTGALGLEALSRGAREAAFMDRDRTAISTIRTNVERCGAEARAVILACDVLRPPLALSPVRYAFLDPPYGLGLTRRATDALVAARWLSQGTVLVAEVALDEEVALPGQRLADRSHGAARFLINRL